MRGKEFKYVLDTIYEEGFEYAFVDYSEFNEIEDEEFHKLRKAYLAAREALAEYVGWEV